MTFYVLPEGETLRLVSTHADTEPPVNAVWVGETMADCPQALIDELNRDPNPGPNWAIVKNRLLADPAWDAWTAASVDDVAVVRLETAAAVSSELWDYLIRQWFRILQATPLEAVPDTATWERWNVILEEGHLPLRIDVQTGELQAYEPE